MLPQENLAIDAKICVIFSVTFLEQCVSFLEGISTMCKSYQ